ncbi:hypothetical protein HCJ66_06265 [Listeria sp. FSL L7-1582]|uniref:NfeD-like C-terminal domain-containing protein n=1 Tax=Listeria newyorkensis TaxID=1497681 RepID=A0A841YYF7_9LIST|nr:MULTISPECIES: NfeD family protein [Listeria]KGL39110.1 hypothetical protein EP56_14445 [Listeriaceae bacterium FSL A5-0209]KGL43903.1 hypothetical protein EP58_05460 [Listeria newyorkensis]KMT61784.1 hypothetical protein X559_1868 [Listeria newyorkensis]MBC1457663.1 hypothetical protein [Listeria newyorkensis]MBC6309155.1 hypothetical protein [Listeria portnoyi]
MSREYTEDDLVYGESWGLVHRGFLADSEIERMKALRDKVMGKHGKAGTTLKPIGRVIIDGEWYDARLKDGYLDIGTPIVVVGIDIGYVLVNEDLKREEDNS